MQKRIAASLGSRSVDGAIRMAAGYEAMNMIRKGHMRWLAKGDAVDQVRQTPGPGSIHRRHAVLQLTTPQVKRSLYNLNTM